MKNILTIHAPENAATKQLKLQNCNAGKKLVISTNLLPLFGFETGTTVVEELIGVGKGIRIRLSNENDIKTKLVYERYYKSRKNNPIETLMDIRKQTLINKAFPSSTEMVHIIFRHGIVEIRPIENRIYKTIQKFKRMKNPLSVTLACSAGIDGFSLQNNEFKIDTLIEYRPHEKRDKKDLTETGALNAIANLNVDYLINEDIMTLNLDKLAALTKNNLSSLYHIALQCDDLTNVKSNSLKEASFQDLSTSLDMVFDCISFVSKFMPPTLLVENVRGFKTSDAGKMLNARLRRLGYTITESIMDGRDYKGMTSRIRYYLVATLLPFSFKMPEKHVRNENPIWDQYIEPYILSGEARLVNHVETFKKGFEQKRIRVIRRDSLHCPTFLKSQDRMAKDSVVIQDELRDNNLYFPSRSMMAELMGIPKEFDFNISSKTIETECIGQSIEYPMHDAIVKQLKEYLLSSHASLNNRLF